MLTKWLKPMRSLKARSRIAVQMAPLWETNARFPATGISAAKLALRLVPGRIMPMQFGPTIRSRPSQAIRRIFSSISRPCAPTSFPPAEMITAPPTFLSTHSLTIAATLSIGVATIARSTSVSIAETDPKDSCPWMVVYLGFTGSNFPENPPSIRFLTSAEPMVPAFSLAPTTAI